MKSAKSFAGVLLALIMVLSMTVTAFAAPAQTTISVADGDSRSYSLYEIFTRDLYNGVLSNIKWGKSAKLPFNEGDAVAKSVLDEIAAISGTDLQKADAIEEYVDFNNPVKTVSAGSSVEVATGYYLIKDDGAVGNGESYSLYVVQVVGPTTIAPKTGTISSEKKVKDFNDTAGVASDWQDSADYDIGDKVPFQLKATLPSNLDNYSEYKLVFHDTLSAGLSYDGDSTVKVAVNGNEITSGFDIKASGGALTITFDDVKAAPVSATAGSVITVEYKATLTGSAVVVGKGGNDNKMYVEYYNNPNTVGDGKTPTTGTTPEDKVVVFTYKAIVDKVDDKDQALSGAAFKLEKKLSNGTNKTIKEFTAGADTTFEFTGLDDGDYILTEIVTPAGYNTIDPVEFRITAEHSADAASPKVTDLSGTKGFSYDSEKDALVAKIVNQAGVVLPTTGGMGTTIFYVLGFALVIGAGVLLVTKKRMNSK